MFHIGILAFPMVQQLDLTGPFEVFSTWPEARVDLVWKTTEPLVSSTGLWLRPTIAFEDAPPFDIICVPGGRGVDPLLLDDEVLDFLRAQALAAKFVTSVCTGALLLGAAGLLVGKRATTHWTCVDLLPVFGAIPIRERVVFDGRSGDRGRRDGGDRLRACSRRRIGWSRSRDGDSTPVRICAKAAFRRRRPVKRAARRGRGVSRAKPRIAGRARKARDASRETAGSRRRVILREDQGFATGRMSARPFGRERREGAKLSESDKKCRNSPR